MLTERNKKAPAWKNSQAKEMLCKDILLGLADDKMMGHKVYEMREEYKMFPFLNFSLNLKSLQDSIKRDLDRIQCKPMVMTGQL